MSYYRITTTVEGPTGRIASTITSSEDTRDEAIARAQQQQAETVNNHSPHGHEYEILSPYNAQRTTGGRIYTGAFSM